ncbi:MAG: hypothetical protein KKG99_06310 [Bacteroidetes bacterium]|nr:hypothetical protein [Bacteroidota bacterium]
MRFENKKLDFTVHSTNPWNHIKKQYFKHLVKFMDIENLSVKPFGNRLYPLYQNLAGRLSCTFVLAFPTIDSIWVFDYIESFIDPQKVFLDITLLSNKSTRIFITCPHRSWTPTWSYNHWHEIDPDRFEWLAEYCGFRVVKHESHTIWQKWYNYFGFRPLFRLLFSRYKLHIYELRLK